MYYLFFRGRSSSVATGSNIKVAGKSPLSDNLYEVEADDSFG